MKSKSILVISYYFYPLNSIGAVRFTMLKKYWEHKGYDVTVITCGHSGKSDLDNTFYIQDPKLNPLKKLANKLKCKLGITVKQRPDWEELAFEYANNNLNLSTFDFIIGTYPKVENLSLAYRLSKKCKAKLILDFRDGFIFESLNSTNNLQKTCKKAFEAELVSKASLVVTVSPPLTNYFMETYKNVNAKTIFNGFDPEDMLPPVELKNKNKPKEILFSGQLSKSRKGENIGLKVFVMKYDQLTEDQKSKYHIQFIGHFSKEELALIEPRFTVKGKVSRSEIKKEQAKADAFLLLVSSDIPSMITGKIFEYLACRKPILSFTNKAYLSTIIENTNSGINVLSTDPRSLDDIFNSLFALELSKEDVIPFSYKNICEDYLVELNSLGR